MINSINKSEIYIGHLGAEEEYNSLASRYEPDVDLIDIDPTRNPNFARTVREMRAKLDEEIKEKTEIIPYLRQRLGSDYAGI